MSQQLVVPQSLQLAPIFGIAAQQGNDDLTQGLSGNFAVVSIKGKCFKIKHGGTEKPLTVVHEGMTYAAPFFDVVMLSSNPNFSKTYYEGTYAEGSDDAPSCSSEDGIAPAPGVPRPQSTLCATCPKNVFGSKISDNGAKGKACQDSRKVAVVPAGDIANEQWGGPMLLRIPPASLGPLADFARQLQAQGIPYYAVVIRIVFDTTVAFPKLAFQVLRGLTQEEGTQVMTWRESATVKTVLGHDAPRAQLPAPAAALPAQQPNPVAAAAAQPAPLPAAALLPASHPAPLPAAVAPQPAPLPAAAPIQAAPLQPPPLPSTAPLQPAPAAVVPLQPAPLPAAPSPLPTQAAPIATAPTQATPPVPAATPGLLSEIDSLLGS
jgi:hypothetical protein